MTAQADLILRPVQAGEIDPITDLWHRGWIAGHEGIVPEGLLAFRNRADFRDRIAGSLGNCFTTDQLDVFVRLKGDELDQFYVHPDRIGSGLGARLMRASEALMAARGTTRAYLIASVGNDRAIGFYTRMGWDEIGTRIEAVETRDGPFEMAVVRFEKSLKT